MRRIARTVGSMLAVLGLMLTMGGLSSAATSPMADGPSTAATSCSGHVSYAETLSNGRGELVIYYNSSNGGTNSACFYHRGSTYGVSAPTSVQIHRCAERSGKGGSCTVTASSKRDVGNYQYYAGPVGVTKTSNHCVSAYGYIILSGIALGIDSGRQGC